jgi:hypothetical protein
MIQNDAQLERTREAIRQVEAALAALYRKKADILPDRFALMAEPVLDQLHSLRADIDAYLGVTEATAAVVPVWLRLKGPKIEMDNAPTSVITAMIDLLRVGIQAVAEYLVRRTAGQRPTALIREACDLRIVGLAGGSVQVGLSLPDLEPELFENDGVGVKVREAFDLYLQTAAWAGTDETDESLEKRVPEAALRRLLLNQVARLIPRPRGQLEAVELSGRIVGPARVQLRKESRDKVRDAVTRTVQKVPVQASGVLREIDLDSRTFVIRDMKSPQETRCEIPQEDDDLLLIAKESLDYHVVVFGIRETDPFHRMAKPLQVFDIDVEGREGEVTGPPSGENPPQKAAM